MKNTIHKGNSIKLFIAFLLYLFVSFFIYRDFINPGIVSGGAENFAPTLDIFLKELVHSPIWSEMFSKRCHGTWIYSPHFPFYFAGKIIGYDVPTLIKLEYIMFLALSGFAMFLLVRYILHSNSKSKNSEYSILIAAFISGLSYMSNLSFKVGDADYIGIQFSFSVFPLIILFFLRAFHEKKNSFAMVSGFFWAEAAAFDQRNLIAPLIVILPYLLFVFSYNNTPKKFLSNLKQGFTVFFMSSLIFLLLGGYYFLNIKSSATIGAVTALTKPAVDVTWSNGDIINLLRASSHFQLTKYIGNIPFDFLASLVKSVGLMLVTLALSSILLYRRNKQILFFSLLLVITGSFAGFGELSRNFIYWLVLDSPFNHFVGRLFRTTRIPDQIMAVSLAILLAFSIHWILDRLDKVKCGNFLRFSVVMLISSLVLVSSAPLLTGDDAGRLHPVKIPEGYREANNWLQTQKGDFKVMWVPEFWGPYQPEWSGGKPVDALTYYGSSKPTYFARNNIMTHYYAYTLSFKYNSLLTRNKIGDLSCFLNPLNIKYVILHDDILEHKSTFNKVLKYLNKDPNFILVSNCNPIYIYEVGIPSSHFGVSGEPILIFGGLETGRFVLMLERESPQLFADAFRINLLNKSYTNIVALTNSKNNIDLCVPFVPEDNIIEVAHHSKFYQGDKWSRAYISDPHHGIWHGFINSFPNQKWEFSYGIQTGFVSISDNRDSLEIPVIIEKDANYLIFARVLKSTKGGEIKINLASLSRAIDTTDKTKAEFVWVKVGEVNLSKGKYTLEIENIKGSNAINILILIPEYELKEIEKKVNEILKEKRIIYVIDGRSDIMFLNNSGGLFSLNIIRDGLYKIAIKSANPCEVILEDTPVKLKKDGNTSWYISHPIELKKGQVNIKLFKTSGVSTLRDDVQLIVLFSIEKADEDIFSIFEVKEKPAEVISYEKVDPTLWKVKVNATRPFMLSFAEAYDPLWEARVYKDGNLVEKVGSIPLYSVVNGFWINETGELEIIIRYKPQDWFEIGLMISATTFIGCIGYLFYDWRRGKEDGWALKIERNVRKILRRMKNRFKL